MLDGLIYLPWLLWVLGGFFALAFLFVVALGLRQFVLDFGWNPRVWFRASAFARKHRLAWWQRKPPVFQMDTRLYVGLPGSGKTLLATYDAIRFLRRGVRVCSNYYIRDPLTGRTAERIESWFDMLSWSVVAVVRREPTVFVIDEIHLWANARFYKQTPGWWLSLVSQRRHYGVGIIGTAQAVGQVEVALRRLLDYVVYVRPALVRKLPVFRVAEVPAALVEDDGKEPRHADGIDRGWRLVPWWVYGGYSTEELVAVEEWDEDSETRNQIENLSARARDVCGRVSLPWLDDEHGDDLDGTQTARDDVVLQAMHAAVERGL